MREPVVAVDLHRVVVPLVRAHHAAHGTEDQRDLVLVRVELAGGSVGWGECSALRRPTYTAEHTAGAWVVLRDELAPALLAGGLPAVVGHPMATAAVVEALTDAVLRVEGRSLAVELAGGASVPRSLDRCVVVGRSPAPADAVGAATAAVTAGAAMVKLKVTPAAADLAAVAAVRAELPEVGLAVDFNGTATPEALEALCGLGLAYVEQPAGADDLVRSAHLATVVDAPVALDESLTSAGSLDAAVALRAGSVANVKPARCGGPHAAASLAARAASAGMGVFVGGMLETGVGRAVALAVAAQPSCTLPTDLGPSAAYLADDLTEPVVLDDRGRVVVPDGPGIGVVPRPERLAACTVDHLRLEL